MGKPEFRVKLECGCVLRLRNTPINDRVRYPCPSNMGHGYSLRWTSWSNGDFNRINASEPSSRSESTRRSLPGVESVGFEDVKSGDRLSFATHSSALRRTVWREGVVVGVGRNSVRVWAADGTQARLDRDRWAHREVGRLP